MRKYAAIALSALVSLALLSGVAQAQNRAPEKKIERQAAPEQQVRKQQWMKGGKYNGRGSTVSNHSRHKLKAPPKGHRWVRDGNDFILIATATGIIASVVRGSGN